MKFLGKLLKGFFLLLLVLALIALGYYFAVTKNVDLDEKKLSLRKEQVLVYDNEGAKTAVAVGKTHAVPYTSIPTHTKNAFITTEDRRFFSHNGFDARRIVKSLYTNLRARSFQQGASTISQQLIKNTHLSQDKTIKRKLQEWKLTRQLEKEYSKEEILEKYLSVIYFGHNCFGLRSAANFYFDKDVDELDLADSAILAGLVKSPNNYSPFKNPTACQKRKTSVLAAMLETKKITKEQYDDARKKPLPIQDEGSEAHVAYSHFVFDELGEIIERNRLHVGGKIEIYTYLDKGLQTKLETTAKVAESTDKTLCVLDGKTLGFKGIFSTVRETQRLPGSLLKPLLVYAPALEEHFLSPATPILDERVDYNGYAPKNYDGEFHGYLSARECLSKSLNVPAVKVLDGLGLPRAVAYLQKMGLPVAKEDCSLALALGGMQKGYSLQALLSAYATLQNGGKFANPAFIKEIRMDGVSVYKHAPVASSVFSEETAYLTTDMLRSAAKDGTAKKLRSFPYAIAAKTGTVGTDKGNTDAYSISYTSRDLVGVWLGKKDNSVIPHTGGGVPCNIALDIHGYLADVYKASGEKIAEFDKPDGVSSFALDKESYLRNHALLLAEDNTPAEYKFTELFSRASAPVQKATTFSYPRIPTPTIRFENGRVCIDFPSDTPAYYTYIIERKDGKSKKTLYNGKKINIFHDNDVRENTTYEYTVIPVFNDKKGAPITLPSVNTSGGTTNLKDKEILEKHWWEY